MEKTKEYLKMANEFSLPVKEDTLEVYCRQHIGESFGSCEMYAAHAINSHDELVAEVERLRESNKRMADAIWRKAIDNGRQVKDMGLTQERFIEQYCCFLHPEQK